MKGWLCALVFACMVSAAIAQDADTGQLPLCKPDTDGQPGCVHPPLVKQKMRAEYPEGAAAPPGDVILSVLVDKKGKPREIAVVQSQGKQFDAAATAAVQHWRFEPAQTSSGAKVPLRINIRIAFPLPDAVLRDALFVCNEKHPAPCAKVAPKPRYLPDPEYSDEARQHHVEGMVKLVVVVDKEGGVGYVKVEKGLGYGLDERSVEAARQWRFDPARLDDGSPVAVRLEVETHFALR